MANASIFAAFERFWLHITAALGNKADIAHTHTVANISDLTATAAELNYCDGVTSNIQTQLNNKAASSHGTHVSYGTSASALGTSSAGSASTVSRSDHVHALPALTSCSGTLTVAKGGTGATTAAGALTNLGLTATAAELNYCDGVTSNIQTQLNGKAPSSHTHTYVDQINANGNILALKDDSAAGLSPFMTNSSTTNLPTFGSFVYSSGYVSKRVSDQANIVLFDYRKGTPAVNTFLTDTWSGWRDLSCEKLYNKYTTRPTSANIASSNDRKGTLEFFHATSSMTTGAPPFEGHILHMNWDNTGGWDSQLCVKNSSAGLAVRGSSNGTWGNWVTMATQDYVREQIAGIGSSTASGQVCEFDSGAINLTSSSSAYTNSKDSKSKWYWIWAYNSTLGGYMGFHVDWKALTTSGQPIYCGSNSTTHFGITVSKNSSNKLVVSVPNSATTVKRIVGYY